MASEYSKCIIFCKVDVTFALTMMHERHIILKILTNLKLQKLRLSSIPLCCLSVVESWGLSFFFCQH